MPTPAEKIAVLEQQINQLMQNRSADNATREREDDRIDARFDRLDERLRMLEHRIAYAAGGIMALQTLISVAIRIFWGH